MIIIPNMGNPIPKEKGISLMDVNINLMILSLTTWTGPHYLSISLIKKMKEKYSLVNIKARANSGQWSLYTRKDHHYLIFPFKVARQGKIKIRSGCPTQNGIRALLQKVSL